MTSVVESKRVGIGRASQFYKKKLSKDEVDRKAVLILKSALKFFPEIPNEFTIASRCFGGEKCFETIIDAEHCECRGPDKPHDHYYIDLVPVWQCFSIQPGDTLVIKRRGDISSENVYEIDFY